MSKQQTESLPKKTVAFTEFQKQFRAARRVSTPLMAICTPDPAATIQTVRQCVTYSNGISYEQPVIHWDIVRGLRAVNVIGYEALAFLLTPDKVKTYMKFSAEKNPVQITGYSPWFIRCAEWMAFGGKPPATIESACISETAMRDLTNEGAMKTNIVEVLALAENLIQTTVLLVANAQRYIEADGVGQGIWNLRDPFKVDRRALVLMAPDIRLPAEIAQDVLILEEPLPTEAELGEIAKTTLKAANMPEPDKDLLARIVDATTGMAAFPVEQVVSMSLKNDPGTKTTVVDVDACWNRKRKVIEQVRGLTVWRGDESLESVGGNANIKTYLRKFFAGPDRPRVLIWLDEIEKMFGGLAGDTSGVTQEMLGKLLSHMEDQQATGMIFVGPPGGGKSMMAKAAGNMARIPTIAGNLGDMKGSLVGQSNENIATAFRVINAISGGKGKQFFVATCNAMAILPPELIRRFQLGIFFFDLPDSEEKPTIWDIWLRKANLDIEQERPDDTGWSGADIAKCCINARKLVIPIVEAAKYVVSVTQSSKGKIEKLRAEASGAYISASHPGVYQAPAELGGSTGSQPFAGIDARRSRMIGGE